MNKPELLVVTAGNDQYEPPYADAQLIKRRVRFGFSAAGSANADQIIIAK